MKVAIMGAGTMGRAIIDGLRKSEPGITIMAYDTSSAACVALAPEVAVVPPESWFLVEPLPDAVIFAVKPSDIASACRQVNDALPPQKGASVLMISIAAGISLEKLRTLFPAAQPICRVMPNTPAKIGEGMSGCACNENCAEADCELVRRIFSACGRALFVPEKLLHAVTGLSGSGPAYVFLFIEALIEAGVTAGLPLAVARECAVQTVIGAAKMVAQSDEHTASLKAKVMSPGGTTAAGLLMLEKHAFKHSVMEAVAAATARSVQLGA